MSDTRKQTTISRLEPYNEIIGILLDVKSEEDQVKLLFITMYEIVLTKDVFTYEQLKAVIGKRVDILNVDGEIYTTN